jgi:hypothetical protein
MLCRPTFELVVATKKRADCLASAALSAKQSGTRVLTGGSLREHTRNDGNFRRNSFWWNAPTRGLGLGLDESAITAIEKCRFRPGTKDGVPVTLAAKIEVNFRLAALPANVDCIVRC